MGRGARSWYRDPYQYHLWSSDNFEILGKYLGELVGIDPCTLDFYEHDRAHVKVKVSAGRVDFELVEVTDKDKDYKITFSFFRWAVVLESEVKLGVDETKWVDIINLDENQSVNRAWYVPVNRAWYLLVCIIT